MDSKIFFESPTAKVYYDSTLDTLFLEYLKQVRNDDEFIIINSEVLTAFEQLNTNKFVADIRKMGVISVASQQWIVKHLIPGLMKHSEDGTVYHAQLLEPSEIFAKVSANNIKNKSSKEIPGFDVKQFQDRTELENYLRSLQPVV